MSARPKASIACSGRRWVGPSKSASINRERRTMVSLGSAAPAPTGDRELVRRRDDLAQQARLAEPRRRLDDEHRADAREQPVEVLADPPERRVPAAERRRTGRRATGYLTVPGPRCRGSPLLGRSSRALRSRPAQRVRHSRWRIPSRSPRQRRRWDMGATGHLRGEHAHAVDVTPAPLFVRLDRTYDWMAS
jgi:hypothetical protein